ncbi:MAG TPA: prepilin-type N-terminal cleavage/methylation domain-containing protein [Gammaproteobacteria bacterium]|nr:prepilin-type N-terminal cleavage/methylation domain-containing protein [Gammaproteobacteria bacterium]
MMRRRSSQGFTLIEIVIVIVLIGSMMAGMTTLFVSNIEKSHRPFLRQRALAVADAFMDEIQYKRWNENSPIGGGCVKTASSCASGPAAAAIGDDGESRQDYDDIDDFNVINNQSPPQDSSGNNMPGYSGYSVTVTVSQPSADWNGVPAADVRLITVSVTSSINETITLTAYRLNI